MHYDISFPHMGIDLPYVGKSVTVFGFTIAFYGMIIGLVILLGFMFAVYEAKRLGENPDYIMDVGMIGVVGGIIGARIYYVAFSWNMYKDNLADIFNLREGGLAIYGAVIGAVLAILVYCRFRKLSPLTLFDIFCIPLITGQMLGRWGNFFNREAFGQYTDGWTAMRLPLDAVRASDVTRQMKEHIQVIDGVSYIQVHPTFLYESLWCLGVLILLVLYRKHKHFNGEVFLLYVTGYALGRVWIEGLRTDQLVIGSSGFAVSQLLAGVLAIGGLVLIAALRIKQKNASAK